MSNDVGMIHAHFGAQIPEGYPSPDVYFTLGYGRAASVTDGGEWVLIEALDGAWQVPLILRTLPDGAKDAISPYGYSGVYASPSLSSSQVHDAWSSTVNCLRELGVISVLVRHSPLVPQASDLPGLRSIISGHPTIVLESPERDSAWSGMAGTCHAAIRKALKNGYTGDVRQVTEGDLAPEGDYRRLYKQTMQRLTAAPSYFFSDAYYTILLDGLGSDLFISEVRDRAGVSVSSSLLMRHGHRLHSHLGGSNQDDARKGSNSLLTWIEMQFAIDLDLRQFHLGGGLGPGDGLYRFKRSFGGRELEYRVSGLIIDENLYEAHTTNRAKDVETTTSTLLASDHFPAYRSRTA